MRTLPLVLAMVLAACSKGPAETASADAAVSKPRPEDPSAIRQTFDAYQAALAKKDGQAAAALVDRTTLDYYGQMRSLALDGSAVQIRRQPVLDKVMILRLRMELAPEELRKLTPEGLIALGVDRGWVGGTFGETGLAEITVEGDDAKAQATVKGQPSPVSWEFRREAGGWRLNLAALTKAMGPALTGAARGMEMSDDEFAVFMIEQATRKKVGPELWDSPAGAGGKR